MALFPPLGYDDNEPLFQDPSASTSRRVQPSRSNKKGLFNAPLASSSSRRNHRTNSLIPTLLDSLDIHDDDPFKLKTSIKTPLPSFSFAAADPRRSVPIPKLSDVTRLEPLTQSSTLLPSLNDDKEILRKNRLECIAELFITIITTRADALTLIPSPASSHTNNQHPDDTVYHFKFSNPIIQPALSGSNSNSNGGSGGNDFFTSMYKPQAAKSTKFTSSGRYSRLWRMAIASLILQEAVLTRLSANIPAAPGHDDDEGEEVFHSASKTFDFLYVLLYDIIAFTSRGFEMTSLASKKSIFDFVNSYTFAGPDSYTTNGNDATRKMNYLDGINDEYEVKLLVYMTQVVASFLVPNKLDPKGNYTTIQGIIETTPSQVPSSSTSSHQHSVKFARELQEIKYFLSCVDEGRFDPNLVDIIGQVIRLPSPLALKKDVLASISRMV